MALGTFDPYAYGSPAVKFKPNQSSHVCASADIGARISPIGENPGNHQTTESCTNLTSADKDDIGSKPAPMCEEKVQNRHPSVPVQGLMKSKFAPRIALPSSEPVKPAINPLSRRSTPTITREKHIDIAKGVVKQTDELSPPSQPDPGNAPSPSAYGSEMNPAVAHRATSTFEITGFGSLREQANNSLIVQPGNFAQRHRSPPNMTRPKSDTVSRVVTPGSQKFSTKVQVTEATLQEVQAAKLRGISTRGKGREKNATTALGHLDLARRPVSGTHSQGAVTPILKAPSHRQSALPAGPAVTPRYTPPGRKMKNVPEIQLPRATQDSPWASQINLKPVEFDVASDTGGSSVMSENSATSKVSNRPFHAGRLLESQYPEAPHPLADWDGRMQPPPTDWNERPRFGHAASELHEECSRWTNEVEQVNAEGNDALFRTVPLALLKDEENHPDGISMISRITTINKQNAEIYGYDEKQAEDIVKYAQPIQPKDFGDWGKLDMNRPENVNIKHETAEKLVCNWTQHTKELRARADADIDQKLRDFEALQEYRTLPNPNRPKINIYLRPATSSDVLRMVDIYNWYIEYSARPCETSIITETEMFSRLDDVQSSKLPFIVAVTRNFNTANPIDTDAGAPVFQDAAHGLTSAKEQVLGWACAQYYSAGDYVEHISAELEMYVDPEYRQLGIGRCLIDQLMEACDRGHVKRGGYKFHCPQEYRHLYNAGGGCDLHKLVFILRKWRYPRDTGVTTTAHQTINQKSNKKKDDQENDYDTWVRKWLESWDFEVEGVLKGAGAKKGRFIDVVHLSHETKWQPAEGRIPDPAPAMY